MIGLTMTGFTMTGPAMIIPDVPSALDSTAHVIQVALTPVFLLSGIATLLSVFGARLARVSDQAEALWGKAETAGNGERGHILRRIAVLRLRSLILDAAVILGALGGIAVCGAVLTLFVGALRDAAAASVLFALFGIGILCTLCALAAFGVEMLLASSATRRRLALRKDAIEDAVETTGG